MVIPAFHVKNPGFNRRSRHVLSLPFRVVLVLDVVAALSRVVDELKPKSQQGS
jgi:hypothetical protein